MKLLTQNYKAVGATLGGSLGALIVWALNTYVGEVTPELEAAIIVVVSAVITWFAPANETKADPNDF